MNGLSAGRAKAMLVEMLSVHSPERKPESLRGRTGDSVSRASNQAVVTGGHSLHELLFDLLYQEGQRLSSQLDTSLPATGIRDREGGALWGQKSESRPGGDGETCPGSLGLHAPVLLPQWGGGMSVPCEAEKRGGGLESPAPRGGGACSALCGAELPARAEAGRRLMTVLRGCGGDPGVGERPGLRPRDGVSCTACRGFLPDLGLSTPSH